MKKVLISDSMSGEAVEVFKKAEGIEVDVNTNLKPDELKAVIGQYDGLAVRSSTKVTGDLLESATNLKVVGRAGAGLDNVDIAEASKRGIVVMNTPGGNTITTAEHAIAMMMAMARRIPQASASMKAGKWEKSKFMGNEFCNKTLGIVGLGRVGGVVADRALGLKMNVLAYDPFIAGDVAAEMGISLVTLDDIFAKSDFISVHSPMTKETKNMINAASFAKMKKGVFIVNCARGGIVNEKDLHDAIVSGKVAGAALDVFEEEPTQNHELIALDQVIATPHLGASTDEAQVSVAIAVAEQMVDYLTKGEIRNASNFPSVSAEQMVILGPFMALGEKLGRFQSQLALGGIQEVHIEYNGEILNYDIIPVTISILKGLLKPILNEEVNDINAPIIAKERGIRVIESRNNKIEDYASLITLTIKTDKETNLAAGTIFGKKDLRIVRANKFILDIIPEGHILLLSNDDKLGVVGNIGTTLAQDGVNIARLHLSRDQVEHKALVVLSIDGVIGAETLQKLRGLPHVTSVTYLEM